MYLRWPDNFAIKFFGRISKSVVLRGKKVLDLGCGGGKDLILIDKMGMSAYGIEISENAIKLAEKYVKNGVQMLKLDCTMAKISHIQIRFLIL